MIDWKCEKCGEPATYISVNQKEEVTAGKARKQWDKDHTDDHGWIMVSGNDLLTYPHAAHWYVSCDECNLVPSVAYYSYWIDINRIDTYEKVIHWTAHLMGKNWLENTDWSDFLRRLCPDQA